MENERSHNIVVFRSAVARLFGSGRYWIEVVVAILTCFISPYIMEMVSKMIETVSPEIIEGFRQGNVYNIGFLSLPSLDIGDYHSCDRIIAGVLSGSVTQCLLVVISTTFIASEFSGGYFIRALVLGYNRSALLTKYLAVAIIGTLPIIIICPASVYVSLELKLKIPITNYSLLMGVLAEQTFMLLGLVVCCTSLAVVVRGKGATIIGLSCVMILPLLPNYIQVFTGGNVKIDKYMLMSRLVNSCNMDPSIYDIIITVVTVAIIYGLGRLITAARNFN